MLETIRNTNQLVAKSMRKSTISIRSKVGLELSYDSRIWMRRQGGNGLRNEIAQVNAVASRFCRGKRLPWLGRQSTSARPDNLT